MKNNLQTSQLKSIGILSIVCAVLAGCGGDAVPATCHITGFAMLVKPADPNAMPDHAAMAPGNQQLFQAALGQPTGSGPCIYHNLYALTRAQWTTSDPQNVTISSADDTTNGVATCIGTTKSGATVSATLSSGGFTETVSTPITCK